MKIKVFAFLLLSVSFSLTNCKDEEEVVVSKNKLSYAGAEYEFSSGPDQTRFADFECMQWNATQTGFIYSKAPGIKLVFFTKDIAVTLNLFGESAGKYTEVTSFCGENQFKTASMIQSRDGIRATIISGTSELEITKKSNGKISGNFKLRVPFDANFLNDSIVSGTFEDVVMGAKF